MLTTQIPGADPYCIVTVEKTRGTTPVQKGTLEPKFDSSLLFYIKRPETANVKIEVHVHVHAASIEVLANT